MVEGENGGSDHLSVLPVVLKRTRGLFKISASFFVSPQLRPREGTTQFIDLTAKGRNFQNPFRKPRTELRSRFPQGREESHFFPGQTHSTLSLARLLTMGFSLSYPCGSSLPGQSWLPWAVSRGPQAPCRVGPFSRECAGLKGLSPLTDVTSFTNRRVLLTQVLRFLNSGPHAYIASTLAY